MRLYGAEPIHLPQAPLSNIMGIGATSLTKDDFQIFAGLFDYKPTEDAVEMEKPEMLRRIKSGISSGI